MLVLDSRWSRWNAAREPHQGVGAGSGALHGGVAAAAARPGGRQRQAGGGVRSPASQSQETRASR